MESMLLDEHLQAPPGQILQLMPAPGQVAHQMPVKARRLQQQARPHQSHDPVRSHRASTACMTAPKAAPLRSKQSHCHGIIAMEMWLARGEESVWSAARLEGLLGVEVEGEAGGNHTAVV